MDPIEHIHIHCEDLPRSVHVSKTDRKHLAAELLRVGHNSVFISTNHHRLFMHCVMKTNWFCALTAGDTPTGTDADLIEQAHIWRQIRDIARQCRRPLFAKTATSVGIMVALARFVKAAPELLRAQLFVYTNALAKYIPSADAAVFGAALTFPTNWARETPRTVISTPGEYMAILESRPDEAEWVQFLPVTRALFPNMCKSSIALCRHRLHTETFLEVTTLVATMQTEKCYIGTKRVLGTPPSLHQAAATTADLPDMPWSHVFQTLLGAATNSNIAIEIQQQLYCAILALSAELRLPDDEHAAWASSAVAITARDTMRCNTMSGHVYNHYDADASLDADDDRNPDICLGDMSQDEDDFSSGTEYNPDGEEDESKFRKRKTVDEDDDDDSIVVGDDECRYSTHDSSEGESAVMTSDSDDSGDTDGGSEDGEIVPRKRRRLVCADAESQGSQSSVMCHYPEGSIMSYGEPGTCCDADDECESPPAVMRNPSMFAL